MFVCVCLCVCVCVRVCVYVCVCVCVCVVRLLSISWSRLFRCTHGMQCIQSATDEQRCNSQTKEQQTNKVHAWYAVHTSRVGQNRVYTPYMAVYLVTPLPKLTNVHRIYMFLLSYNLKIREPYNLIIIIYI